MFSGIIETLGLIKKITPLESGFQYIIYAPKVIFGTKIGDSIATDGICLTVVKKTWTTFTVEAMKETIERTALKLWKVGSKVNLERALATGQRNGGHQVMGHVDATGFLKAKREEGIATVMTFEVPMTLTKYMIEKGSIAVDGVSLTLNRVTSHTFDVWLIPHTKEVTQLATKAIGDPFNIEVDMIGKYIEKLKGQ
jgi:riboflavin synthase